MSITRSRVILAAVCATLMSAGGALSSEACIKNTLGGENLVPQHLVSRCDAQVLGGAECKAEFKEITEKWNEVASAELHGTSDALNMRLALRTHVLSWCARYNDSLPVRLGHKF